MNPNTYFISEFSPCLQGGEPDLILWQRWYFMIGSGVKYPFCAPPQRQDETSEELNVNGVDVDAVVDSNRGFEAFKAIVNVLSFQQQRSVPLQRDLFSENELKEESSELLIGTEDNSEDISATDGDTVIWVDSGQRSRLSTFSLLRI
ncbi:hypothetical protein L6164_018466 [Bauhinia variegata]|uniref:Uncharacterized protein n=1 Tax=Bauhinia variegata TaxID=167791 RepID=A0ACB9NCP4_BAUVA|nr:hypothetical protein L6164_018466 [Bauhinia variegata]